MDPTKAQQVEWHINEGDSVSPNQKLFTLRGNTRVLLTGERAALNFLQTLSATATSSSPIRRDQFKQRQQPD